MRRGRSPSVCSITNALDSSANIPTTLLLLLDSGAALLTSTVPFAVFQHLMARTCRLSAVRAEHHHIRNVDRRLALEYPALNPSPRVCLIVALHHVYALDDNSVLRGLHFDNAPLLAFVFARNHYHAIVFSNVNLDVHFTGP